MKTHMAFNEARRTTSPSGICCRHCWMTYDLDYLAEELGLHGHWFRSRRFRKAYTAMVGSHLAAAHPSIILKGMPITPMAQTEVTR